MTFSLAHKVLFQQRTCSVALVHGRSVKALRHGFRKNHTIVEFTRKMGFCDLELLIVNNEEPDFHRVTPSEACVLERTVQVFGSDQHLDVPCGDVLRRNRSKLHSRRFILSMLLDDVMLVLVFLSEPLTCDVHRPCWPFRWLCGCWEGSRQLESNVVSLIA